MLTHHRKAGALYWVTKKEQGEPEKREAEFLVRRGDPAISDE